METLYSALLGAGVPSIACIILCWLVWRQLTADSSARKRLEEKVTTLETEKFSRLERRVEDHINADRSQQILNELKNLKDSAEKTLNLTIAAREDNAAQAADIKNLKNYLGNLRDDLRDHTRICKN